jgi:hypothetical protein
LILVNRYSDDRDKDMSLDQFSRAIAGTKGAIDIVSKISDLAIKNAQIELQEEATELREKLLDVKELLLDVRAENLDLKEEIRKLKSNAPKLELEEKGFLFYAKGIKQPVCHNCSMDKSKPVVLSKAAFNVYKCSSCQAETIIFPDPKSAANCF